MTLEELRNKIAINKISERWYSLDEGLKPNALILSRNHGLWEFFYMDEKGGRDNEWRIFITDEDAYDWLWEHLESNLKYFKKET